MAPADPPWTSAPTSTADSTGLKKCPYCAEEIQALAIKCKHCGSGLSVEARERMATRSGSAPEDFNAGIAVVLSFFIPGLGQLYRREFGRGLAWLFFVPICWLYGPGSALIFSASPNMFRMYFGGLAVAFVMHLMCIIDAARQSRRLLLAAALTFFTINGILLLSP